MSIRGEKTIPAGGAVPGGSAFGFRTRWKPISVALLSILALTTATLTAYSFSILSRGEWEYRELIAPICTAGLVTLLLLGLIATVCTRGRSSRTTAGLTLLLIAACSMLTAGVFFGVLDNCRLRCGTRPKMELKSPTGRWTAVWLIESCPSTSRYCPTISHVIVVAEAEPDRAAGEAPPKPSTWLTT